jgi:hypothetical protein
MYSITNWCGVDIVIVDLYDDNNSVFVKSNSSISTDAYYSISGSKIYNSNRDSLINPGTILGVNRDRDHYVILQTQVLKNTTFPNKPDTDYTNRAGVVREFCGRFLHRTNFHISERKKDCRENYPLHANIFGGIGNNYRIHYRHLLLREKIIAYP